jgi:Na+-translocating ferredoxin:NAD+ oxidoreductase subunit B
MLVAIAILTILGLVLGWLLGVAARYLRVEDNPIAEQIESLLPGSQCGQCGYPGCNAAAMALADAQAPPTLCPPGGRALVAELATLLGVTEDLSGVKDKAPVVAHIHENLCVGCTKCFKRCPTDAILGGPKMIHAVFTDACTGCEKCFDVCPTQCIEMRPVVATLQTWYWPNPAQAA